MWGVLAKYDSIPVVVVELLERSSLTGRLNVCNL